MGEEVLLIESVKTNLDGTVELEGHRMSRRFAHMKTSLGSRIAREESQHALVSKNCSPDVVSDMYATTVAPLIKQRDSITGQRHTVTVADERDYFPGMIYPLGQD